MRRYVRYALVLFTGFPTLLGAQGYGIFEQGTCTMGRAGTAVAAPCADGSAIFFNPAGLAGLAGKHISAGVTLIKAGGNFTDDLLAQKTDLDDPIIPVPQAYVSYALTPKWGVGVGLFAPYGLETKWPTTFDGRFAGYKNIIRTIYIQPTVAYQVTPRLSVGGGVDIVTGKVELNQRLDLAEQIVPTSLGVPPNTSFGQFGIPPGTDFADAHLEATATTVTGHLGALIKLSDRVSIGGRYLHFSRQHYGGHATFTQDPTGLTVPATIAVGSVLIPAGTKVDDLLNTLGVFSTVLADSTAKTTVTNPEQVVLGLAVKARENLTLLADYQWTRWNRLSTLNIIFDNPLTPTRTLYESYRNTNGYRFGAEWVKDAKWTFRGGYLYHNGAAPAQTVTPLLPEGSRNELTGGAGVKVSPQFTVDFAYQFVRQNDRRGRTREPANSGIPTTGLNNGLFAFSAHLFGVSFAYSF